MRVCVYDIFWEDWREGEGNFDADKKCAGREMEDFILLLTYTYTYTHTHIHTVLFGRTFASFAV